MLLECPPEQHSTFHLIKQVGIDIKGKNVLFAGSHDLIEKQLLQRLGVNIVYCFECNPFVYQDLVERIKDTNWKSYLTCLWSESNLSKEYYFYRNNKDGAGGLYKPDKMGDYVDCPLTGENITVQTSKLDDYEFEPVELLILDLQGSELEALKGATKVLQTVKYIICEASTFECYKNAPIIQDIVEYLMQYDFFPVKYQVDWGKDGNYHGDLVFVKK